MQGLLADVNVQGHLPYLRRRLDALGLSDLIITELKLSLVTFPDIGIDRAIDDRKLWQYCQDEGWILFTEDRKRVGPNSLQATLNDSWRPGHLPVLTLAKKSKFENDRDYADLVATNIAEILIDIAAGEGNRDTPRIYIPLT